MEGLNYGEIEKASSRLKELNEDIKELEKDEKVQEYKKLNTEVFDLHRKIRQEIGGI